MSVLYEIYFSPEKQRNHRDYIYAVNLQLNPVDVGIRARVGSRTMEFNGFRAVNHYFDILAPDNGFGSSLPDIWDGYYHITLAKFEAREKPADLQNRLRNFKPDVDALRMLAELWFCASKLRRASGADRIGERQDIDFIILPIDITEELERFYDSIQNLLGNIRGITQATKWNMTHVNELHVTVRKYNTTAVDISRIPIAKCPLEFKCVHLEIKQTREEARRFSIPPDQWWRGVTEINGKCSGCQTAIFSNQWQGYCVACGEYESLKPLWSSDGRNFSFN